ncbi:hypothetical protein RCO28_35255 [Streptomyces sp. LHD-70]|uniref:hypothetical protein n=1 Tax=Streptomyces sp. LHD-70 TaxID=3072140 RepID=UPI00280F56A4|nr:hypothetical protein [Streptomyces sp. LHD-70]MDQ8707692.1 hypothetical protein [Streptomyces sp. LHD-70]
MERRGTGRWTGRRALWGLAAGSLLLPAQGAHAAEEPRPYVFASGAQRVEGAEARSGAQELNSGSTYRSSIGPGRTLYYAVELDSDSSVYASAVAVPRFGTEVAYGDRIAVTLQDQEGNTCGSDKASFGTADYAAPLAATAERLIDGGGTRCRETGTYFVVVQRGSADDSSRAAWDLELSLAAEPRLAGSPPTEAPAEAQDPVDPPPPTGAPQGAEGGTGFNDARLLGHGVWQDRVRPGRTRFYRVPVGWGQQLSAQVELEGAKGGGGGVLSSVPKALNVSVHNPARTTVTSAGESYRGDPVTTALEPLAAVAYENRYAARPETKQMRFPGSYYLKVSLDPKLREQYGEAGLALTLRVGVTGERKTDVAYEGDAGPFRVTEDGTDAPVGGSGGGSGGADGGDADADAAAFGLGRGVLSVVATAGIGTGTGLVLVLVLWTLLARRIAARRTADESA